MYGENPKKRKGLKPGQFEVHNIHSGRDVTFMDDGVNKDGEPNQQRQAAMRKFAARDEDGDPLFVPVQDPLPRFILEQDMNAGQPLSGIVRSLDDRSKNPNFATLRDKYHANARLRSEFEAEMAEKRAANPNPAQDIHAAAAERKAKKKASDDALKAGPLGKAKAQPEGAEA